MKINLRGKSYRAPNSIPPNAREKIRLRMESQSSRQTYFSDALNEDVIEHLILETSMKPGKFYVEEGSSKIIYRAQQFKEPIGYDPVRQKNCHWLLVVAVLYVGSVLVLLSFSPFFS